jgi:hypothetical protein
MKLLAAALAALTATIVERTEGQATGATRYQGEKFMRARLVHKGKANNRETALSMD